MFKSKIRMWSVVINHIPAARLESWAWWLGVFAIILPLLGGVCGWLSFEMNDTVTHRKEVETQQQIADSKDATLRYRLIDFLNSVNADIIPAFSAGTTHFTIELSMRHFKVLQRLSSEPKASEYIVFHPIVPLTTNGQYIPSEFDLKAALLKP
jgi:hypothetical protein